MVESQYANAYKESIFEKILNKNKSIFNAIVKYRKLY